MPRRDDDDDAIWVPVTINLPLGFTKSFSPENCAPLSLLCGPFAIILLAQTANTVLVPVLPFLVKDVGSDAVTYGLLQSTLWTSQTMLAPVLGYLSDKLGRRPVIFLSLLFSAAGNALLAVSESITLMIVARVISGLGFQIPLLRAYFADTSPKESRTGRFGLIGVITSASLFVGPSLGGEIARAYGRRAGCWLSAGLCVLASFISFLWHPDEAKVDEARMQRSNTFALKGDELAHHLETHRTVNGVKMVRIDLGGEEEATSPTEAAARDSRDASGSGGEGGCCQRKPCRTARKAWRFAKWLGTYDLWPLMSLNFFFRFAFAAYKSVFAFFCMALLNYGAREVGYLLSCMGIGGMFVQGVLVRVAVGRLGEEKTLFLSMAATSAGFVVFSCATSLHVLAPALALIAIGYGLTVPCLSTLFSNVPVEQGIMQGIAGAIDRFGQAFGPIVGGVLLSLVGEVALMRWTGIALALVAAACLAFIGDGCTHWMREIFCYKQAGYRQVGHLDSVEEEDEEGLEMESSPSSSPRLNSQDWPAGWRPATAQPAGGGLAAAVLNGKPVSAQPASVTRK